MKQHTLSKTAERIYWLGRYLERAESTARLVNVNGNLLIDLPRRIQLSWVSLIDIMGMRSQFYEHYETPDERSVVRYLVTDTNNPGSLLTSLSMARENARTIREIMPRVAFEYINDLYLYAKERASGTMSRSRTSEMMEGVMRRVQHIAGFLSGTMLHGDTWSFLRIGEFLERADMTTRIIDVRSVAPQDTAGLEPYSQLQWRSVLRSLHALQAFHLAVQEPIQQSLVLEFLFTNDALPRSLAYTTSRIRSSLRSLPRNQKPLSAINRVIRFLDSVDVATLKDADLHTFIDDCQRHLSYLDKEISRTYFHARLRVAEGQSQTQTKRTTTSA
ncbi:MAG TPA: alpha-E domain-containing protein [Pseudomonadales bacterium]|nr:alpha-E domain-containing protein [Pseudomonadales bacterium]